MQRVWKAARWMRAGFEKACAELRAFLAYLKAHFVSIALCNAVFMLVYSPWIFHPEDVHIDTSIFFEWPNSTYNWLDIGRQGLILTRKLFGQMHYNPYFATSVGYGLIALSGVVMGYLAYRCAKRCAPLCSALGMLVCTAPIHAEQFYFDNQILEIGFAYVLVAAASALSFFAIVQKQWLLLIPVIALLIWAFSSYQALIILFVALAIFLYVLLMRRWIAQKDERCKNLRGGGTPHRFGRCVFDGICAESVDHGQLFYDQ